MRNTISFLIDGEPITVRAYICICLLYTSKGPSGLTVASTPEANGYYKVEGPVAEWANESISIPEGIGLSLIHIYTVIQEQYAALWRSKDRTLPKSTGINYTGPMY